MFLSAKPLGLMLLTWLLVGLLAWPDAGLAAVSKKPLPKTVSGNKPIPLSGQFFDPYGIVPQEARFVWQPEVEPGYQLEKESLRHQESGPVGRQKDAQLYERLYTTGLVKIPFSSWRAHWGPRPLVFQVQVDVNNWAYEVSEPAKVSVDLYAKLSQALVKPQTLLLDRQAMDAQGRWVKFDTVKGSMPILAPEESFQWVSPKLPFGEFLLKYPDHIPTQLKAIVTIDQRINDVPVSRQVETAMPIFAGHFDRIRY
ncbi:MAG: hypothetical protein KC475_05320 [Cyanobacteria bacterium HKST-UBA03]|nr:hypothetical protein [Cyanobacteria bacterium HKST-UBA03]